MATSERSSNLSTVELRTEMPRERRAMVSFRKKILVAGDVWAIWMAGFAAWYFRFMLPGSTLSWTAPSRELFVRHLMFVFLYSFLFVLCGSNRHLYSRPWTRREFADVAATAIISLILVGFAIYASHESSVSRQVVGGTALLSVLTVAGWRIFARHLSVSGVIEQRHVVIVGAGKVGKTLGNYIKANPGLGYKVVGYLDRRLAGRYAAPPDADDAVPLLGTIIDIESIVRRHFVDEIFITLPSDRNLVKDIAQHAARTGVDLRVVPDLYDGLAAGAPVEVLGQFPTLAVYQQPIPAAQLVMKRTADVVVSAFALLALLPFLFVLAIAIKLDSEGPVFYSSDRVGKKGRIFRCHKFRTMVVDAERRKQELAHLNERDGLLFKISNDPRITRLGRLLRKFSVDELPQLWNVLVGEMSLVGPRPPVPGEYSQYELGYLRRLEVMPGITGLWQVEARQSPSFEDYIRLDLEYVDCWSLWMDIKLLLRTIRVVVAGTGH